VPAPADVLGNESEPAEARGAAKLAKHERFQRKADRGRDVMETRTRRATR
jgi:hypothetical protein